MEAFDGNTAPLEDFGKGRRSVTVHRFDPLSITAALNRNEFEFCPL
jgi:hypothetical protein